MPMAEEIDDNKLIQAYQYWHDCGFDEGYDLGYDEGYEVGFGDGRKEIGSKLDEETQGS